MSTLKNKSKNELIEEIESLKKQIQELKGNEDILEESEEKFVKTFNSSPSPMIISEIETGKVVDVNNAFSNMVMYTKQEIIGKSVLKLNLWANPKDRDYYVKKMKEDKRVSNHEIKLRTKSGDIKATLISGEIIEINGKHYLFTSGTDITERKQSEVVLEKSEEKLRAIFDCAADALVETDISGNILKVNKATFRIYGSDSEEDYLGKSALEFYAPFDKMRALKAYRQTYYESIAEESEFTALKVDGTPFPVQITSAVIRDADEKPIGFVGIIKDITERKQAEEALRASEEQYQTLVRQTPAVLWTSDQNGQTTFISSNVKKVYGYTSEEIIKSGDRLWFGRIHSEDLASVKAAYATLMKREEPYDIEYRIQRQDGDWIWLHDRATCNYEVAGTWRADGVFFDITERKLAEKALRESEEKFRRLAENSPDIIYRHRLQPNPGFEYISPAIAKISGYTPKEHYNDPELGLKIIHPDDKPELDKLATGKFSNSPHISRWIHKDGTTIWIEDKHSPVYDAENNLIAVEGVARNITERKNAEEALRQSEIKFRALFETMTHGVVYQDANGKIISANPAGERILGLTITQMQGRTSIDHRWKTIHEDGSDFPGETHPSMTALETGEQTRNVIMGIFNPSLEEYRWLNVHAIPEFKIGENKPYQVYTIFEDITDRKQVDDALIRSEKRYRALFDQSPIIIWEEDFSEVKIYIDNLKAKGIEDFKSYFKNRPDEIRHIAEMIRVTDINQKSIDFYEAENKEKLITELSSYFTEESWSVFREEIIALAEGQTEFESEIPIRTSNNEQKLLIVSLSILPEHHKTWEKVIVSFIDITERKQAEEKLRESEERYRITAQETGQLIYSFDPKSGNVQWAGAIEAITGFSKEEFQKFNTDDWLEQIHPDHREMVVKIMEDALEQHTRFDSEYRLRRKNGDYIFVEEHGAFVKESINAPYPIVGAITNITRRKHSEEALKESEEKYRELFEAESDAHFLIENETGNIIESNIAAEKLYGYTKKEFAKKKNIDLSTESEKTQNVTEQTPPNKEEVIFIPLRYHKKRDGTVFPVEITGRFFNWKGKSVHIAAIRDITERKQAEEALRESEQKFREMADLLPQIVYETDASANLTFSNKQSSSIFGYSENELLNNFNVLNNVVPEDRDRAKENMQRIMKGKHVRNSEYSLIKKDGSIFPVLIYSSPVIKDNKPVGLRGIVVDISERKLAEKLIQESERRLATLMSNLPGMAYKCKNDPDWTMEFISDGCHSLTGYYTEELVDNSKVSYADLIHPEDRQMVWDKVQDAIEMKQLFQLNYRITAASGAEKWVWEQGQAIYGEENNVISLEGFITDITERKKADKKLRDSHNQLRSLAERLQMIREEERATVAREIHDDLGQTLTALKMDIAWMKKNSGMTDEMRISKLDGILGLTDSTIQTVKRIATDLRPGILDDLGLVSAIEWQTKEFQNRSGIECNFEIFVDEFTVEDDISIAVFRIFQESLTNIARHSGATKVKVTIMREDDFLLVEISDNGVGISEEQISSSKSLGLIGMNERVSVFRGKLTFSKAAEGGTAVRVYIPIGKV